MSKAFQSIKRGLNQAVAHQRGKNRGVRVHTPSSLDVQALRKKVGLTQQEFAARFGISVATLRHWERGDRRPHGAGLVLLQVIDKKPRAVLEALS